MRSIQIYEHSFIGERPDCPVGGKGCSVHRHGSYEREVLDPQPRRVHVRRFWCGSCRVSVSVLPSQCLPYRPITIPRLEGDFDRRAELPKASGLDPPPKAIEEGCLQRAWKRLVTRVKTLKNHLGQILSARVDDARCLWREIRQRLGPLQDILKQLARANRASLLGDYNCLSPPPQA